MHKTPTGITGFDDARFWIALLCYGLSLPLFFEGNVSWDKFQIVMPSLIVFIVVTTLAWDFRIIGNPGNLFCLILHIAFMTSLVFLLNRLMTMESFELSFPGWDSITSTVKLVIERTFLLSRISSLFEFGLKWFGFAVVLFFVAGAIIFPPRVATVLLMIFGMLFVIISAGQNFNKSLWSLGAGILLNSVAFALQMEDERRNSFWNRVAEKLRRGDPRPAMDMKIKIALLQAMQEERALSEKRIRGLIASKLDTRSDDPRLNPVCVRIADQLATQDGLAESRDGNQGWRFVLTVPEDPPDFYTMTARVVRVIVTLGFCVIYVLSPIDIIPDATPVFGVVDDMLLGGVGLLSSIKTIWGPGYFGGRTMGYLPFDKKD